MNGEFWGKDLAILSQCGQRTRRRQPLSLVLFTLCLCLYPSAVGAEIIPVEPDQPPPPILQPAEVERLLTLQNTKELFLLSAVSPDDTSVVFAAAPVGAEEGKGAEPPVAGFLAIRDGSLQEIDPSFFMHFPQSEVVWRDAQTAVYLSSGPEGEPVMVSLDRATGAVESSPLSLPGRPISLAPGGRRLLAEDANSTGVTLTALDLTTGALEPLVEYPHGGTPSSIAWSADGTKLAWIRTLIPAELAQDGERLMELATAEVLGRLPLDENPFFQGNVVDVFDLASNDLRLEALRASDGDGSMFKLLAWSPDGETLLAKMVRPSLPLGREHPTTFFPDRAYFRFYDADLAAIGTLDLPEIEAAQATHALFVSPDELLFAAPNGATFHLYLYHLGSGEFGQLPAEDGTFAEAPYGYQILATHSSRQLIYNQSSFLRPAEIYRLGLDGGDAHAITDFHAAAAAANRIRVTEVSLKLRSNVTRSGYLLLPESAAPETQPGPVVLYQQGGPGGAMTNRWGATADEPFNLLPNFGIGVLFMPFAGREGLGPESYNRLVDRRGFGTVDINEAAQAVRSLIGLGYTAPGQVGIAGGSYGGYFAAQSLVHYPNLYAAANAQYSPVDLVPWWESEGRLLISYVEGSTPDDGLPEYRRDSPLQRADRIRTPLLLFHGEDDFLDIQLVRDFHNLVAADGTPVTMLAFQQEGHTLSSPANRSTAAQCQIDWFRKYLTLAPDAVAEACGAVVNAPAHP